MKAATLIFGPPIAAMLAFGQAKPAPMPVAPPPIEQTQPKKTFTSKHTKPIRVKPKAKVEKLAPGKAQLKPRKEQGKATGGPSGLPRDAGPDLPYSCAVVRMYAAGKSRAELEAMGRANGITAKQKAQAQACLK